MSTVLRAKRGLERRCGPVRFERDRGNGYRVGLILNDIADVIGAGDDHLAAIADAHQTLTLWAEQDGPL